MSLLDRIFYEASTTACEMLASEKILKRIPASHAQMQTVLDNSGMDEEHLDQAYLAWERSCLDDERQGFRNGFRFGFLLARELLGTAE